MRKLATAAAVSLALASGGAFGLGLGDIEMRSALNQPMQAEIRLTAVKAGELNGMTVQLASADAFARAGIDRSTVLTDLSFSVDSSGPSPVIRISSGRPVTEPFLNFLLEVDWPQGRMIREYTVLLDPPVFMTSSATDRNSAGDQATVVDRGAEALVVPTPIDRDLISGGETVALDSLNFSDDELIELEVIEGGQQFDEGAFEVESFDSLAEGEVVSLTDLAAPNTSATQERIQNSQDATNEFEVELLGGLEENTEFVPEGDGSTIVSLSDLSSADTAATSNGTVSVNRGDTLYEIARSNAVGGASIQQMMLALLKANDSSFINSNINLVKAGSTLRVPDASEATRLSQAEALSAITEQNQLWRDYRDQLRGGSATRLASIDNSTTIPTQVTQPQQEVELIVDEETETGGFADRAQSILDNAREEIREREDLRLVAENTSSSSAGNATADDSSSSDTDPLGDVNRKLQLVREDLSSNSLQSAELEDQASELLKTAEDLDSLVELRQTGVANLEAQLAEAKRNGQATVGSSVTGVGDVSLDVLADASNSIGESVDTGTNALTAAGGELGEVELYSEADDSVSQLADNQQGLLAENQTVPVEPIPWYQNILAQPMKLLIAAGALLGVLGLMALLFWRRRRGDDVAEEVGFGDDVDFIDENEAAELQAELSQDRFDSIDNFDDFGEVGSASVATAVTDEYDSSEAFDEFSSAEFDGAADVHSDVQDMEFGNEIQGAAVADATLNDSVNSDDTISEVDVYLNYGLHGQAEELLNKAVESQPNNPNYARKLLETYHGQRSGEKYLYAAKNFHARFGGETNPEWNDIASDGADLLPDEPLFQSTVAKVETQTSGFGNESVKLTDDDFLPADGSAGGSINRSIDATNNDEFLANSADGNSDNGNLAAPVVAASAAVTGAYASLTSNTDSVEFDLNETDLADQTLDPAFAFDEADLDATSDFSQISDELAAANVGQDLDFTSFDDTMAVTTSADSFLDNTIADPDDLSGALTMEEMDGVYGSTDDLTLDLDQLSGDLDLDSAELMNPDLSDIDLPEMSLTDDLNADDLAARASSNDSSAMETMLDLAKAYIDMGDADSASSALDEIVKSGTPAQVTEAETLLRNIS